MISVYLFKKKFQDILRPITDFLAKAKITANMVTIFAFLLSVLTGVLVYLYAPNCKWYFLTLPIFLFIRMALNAIDGMLAREHNQKSDIGAILNELGDIVSDAVIYIPFLYVLKVSPFVILLLAITMLISETVGIMSVQIGASRHYEGPMGKSDRAFWFSIIAIVLLFTDIPCNILYGILYAILALLIYTIFNRITGALKEKQQ